MAGERLLNEAQCKAAKPRSVLYYLNDGGGLSLTKHSFALSLLRHRQRGFPLQLVPQSEKS